MSILTTNQIYAYYQPIKFKYIINQSKLSILSPNQIYGINIYLGKKIYHFILRHITARKWNL